MVDRALQELRTLVGALGSSVVDVAESLRKEIQQGNQQAAQALPVMFQATQAALVKRRAPDLASAAAA